mmetsp:Transcript_20177/g.35987  ORF Transcript_20177/g.35987 Transcript_20177/m.35987 type:complete len:224 (-) Transcript_20177:729-1400(-)
MKGRDRVGLAVQGEGLVGVGDAGVLGDHLPVALQQPARGEEALHADGPARVDATGADAHLCAQPKPKTVRKPGARIVVDTRAVHTPQKVIRRRAVLRHNALCVARAVGVDVIYRLLHIPHYLHRHVQRAVLVTRRRGRREAGVQCCRATRAHVAAVNRHARRRELFQQPRQPSVTRPRLVHKNLLHCVTSCGVINLGVDADGGRSGSVRCGIDVNVTDSVGMA